MNRHHHRKETWPVWKVAVAAIVSIVIAANLTWLAMHLLAIEAKGPATAPASPNGPVTPRDITPAGNIVLLLALLTWATAAAFIAWLGHKLYMRIPAWRRRQMFGGKK